MGVPRQTHVSIYIYMYMCILTYILYIYIYMYIYISIYMYIRIHTYIYIYTYIRTCSISSPGGALQTDPVQIRVPPLFRGAWPGAPARRSAVPLGLVGMISPWDFHGSSLDLV